MLLKDKVAIVTGAAQGIGEAIAISLAEEGAIPVIVDLNKEASEKVVKKIIKKGIKTSSFSIDVSNVSEIKEMVASVVKNYGSVDVLVNNAGILHSTPVEDITEEEWDKMMEVNLKSVFFTSQQVLPFMKEKHWGRIINMSSLAGRMGGYATGLGYTASKAGIIGLTRGFARRVAEYNITVNTIAPGTTRTKIIEKFTDEDVRNLEASIPLKKLGKPENIADTVAFLASDKAEFITGATIDINGGLFTG